MNGIFLDTRLRNKSENDKAMQLFHDYWFYVTKIKNSFWFVYIYIYNFILKIYVLIMEYVNRW